MDGKMVAGWLQDGYVNGWQDGYVNGWQDG
jgi:hypothetical protein